MSNVLNFDVYKNTLQRTDGLPPVSSERNYSDIVCHFKDEDWGGIGVLSAGFYVTEKQVYSVGSSMLEPDEGVESTDRYTAAFKIPTVLVGNRNPIYFGICKSFLVNNEVVKTIATNVVAIDVARGVVIPSDLTPAEEASLYEQLLAAVGEVLDAKADKSYVDDELDLKADAATTYTKSETDGLLDQKADNATTLAGYGISDAYTKSETTNLLADKADKATTLAGYGITDAYTKTDVESALAGKADVNHTHSQYLTEHQDISGKADIADIPTKTSQLQNDSGFLTAHQDISGKVNFVEVVRNDVTKNEVDSCLSENTIYHVYLRTAVVSYDWAMVRVLKTSQFIIQYALTTSEYVIFRRAAISNGVIGTWNSWDFIPNHTKTNELINDAIAGKANIADVPTKTSDLTNDSGFLTSHQDISGKADKSNTVFYQELIGAHSGITNIDQLANDSKTIYRVIIGENSGLLFNINTNQKNFQYILMNNGDVLQRSKQLNTEWNNKEFTTIIPDISGKADIADIPTKTSDLQNDSGFLTEHQSLSDYYTKAKTQNIIDLSVYSKLRLDNGKLIYTDDDIPYDLGDAKNVFYTKTEIDTALSGKESAGNKVTSISSSSTDAQYPSAKAVYNKIGDEIGRTIDYTFSTSGSGLISGLTVEAGKNGDYYLTFYDSSYHPHHLFNLSSILPDISGKADTSAIPTKTSDLQNDSGFLTAHQDISGKADASSVYTKTQTDDKIYEGIDDTLSETDSSTVPRLTIAQHNGAYWLTYFDSEHSVHYLYNISAIMPDISGKANIADIPTKTSDLQNDSGFLTEHQSLLNYYNKTDVNNLLNGKANASHTHAQYLTQHQDISGKADKSDTYTKAEVDAAIQSAPGIIVFAQENAAVTAYLQNANYSASDYSGSVVETYNTNTYGTNRDRPVGKSLTIPSGAASIRLLDTLSGDAYTAAVSGQSYSLKSLIPDRMYLYTFLSAGGAVVGSGSVIFNGKVRMIDAGGSTFNIRDIGGWRCDGGTLAYGKIIRGCELNDNNYNVSLTSEQQRFFREFLNIRDEIDLRNASQTDGADNQQGTSDDIVDTALGDGVTYARYPVVEYATGLDLSNAVYTANYASCIKRIADDLKKGLPIYLHCMAGADRTGTVCALIEAICGVSQTDIDKEFELTTFSGNTRRRNGTSWSGMVTLINSFTGDTFRDKVLYYMLHAGVTIDEINTIRKGLINGYAHELSEPEQPAGRIPAEYQEVEYIASSGTQTIQIPFDSTYDGGYIEMDIKRTNSGVRGLIGSASTNTVDIGAAGGTYFGWTTTGFYEMGPSQTSSITSSTSSFDHVKFEWTAAGSGKLTVNGTVATSRSGSTAYSRWNVFGGTAYPVSCQMKDVVVYNIAGGGAKTAHLVPCYRKADNVIGMYDIVTDTFYTNIGSGTFTKGADVTE